MSMIAALMIGSIAGWIAGLRAKAHGQGLPTNIVVGILGAVIASFLLPVTGWGVGDAGSVAGAIIHATFGAVILLVLLRLLKQV